MVVVALVPAVGRRLGTWWHQGNPAAVFAAALMFPGGGEVQQRQKQLAGRGFVTTRGRGGSGEVLFATRCEIGESVAAIR